jgi:hypothetical protein
MIMATFRRKKKNGKRAEMQNSGEQQKESEDRESDRQEARPALAKQEPRAEGDQYEGVDQHGGADETAKSVERARKGIAFRRQRRNTSGHASDEVHAESEEHNHEATKELEIAERVTPRGRIRPPRKICGVRLGMKMICEMGRAQKPGCFKERCEPEKSVDKPFILARFAVSYQHYVCWPPT